MKVGEWPRFRYRAVVVLTPKGKPVVDGEARADAMDKE